MPVTLSALATARSTNMPTAATVPYLTPRESGSLKMPEKPTPALCPTSSCSAADFHARLSALPVHVKDSEIQGALSSLSLPAWLKPGTLHMDAVACEDAYVSDDAILTDCAIAKGSSYIGKNALVAGHAVVQDYANITAGLITDTACVCGYATIWSEEQRLCAPVIRGNARIYGGISGNVICRGNALILPGTSLVNRTNDCFIFEDDRVSVELAEHKPPTKETRAHDFQR